MSYHVHQSRQMLAVLFVCIGCASVLGEDPTDAPASDTPASDTPASDTPASDTPASDTPASDGSGQTVPDAPSLKEQDINRRLTAANTWIAVVQGADRDFGSLVLSVEFFQRSLHKHSDGTKTNSVVGTAQKWQLAAVELYRLMNEVATSHADGTDAAQFMDEWLLREEEFFEAMKNVNTPYWDVSSAQAAWKDFLRVWRVEVNKKDPDRFQDALQQAPVIILGVLSKFDKKHIAAAASTGNARSSSSRTTGTGTGNSHHTRAMSRIHRRHAALMRVITGR